MLPSHWPLPESVLTSPGLHDRRDVRGLPCCSNAEILGRTICSQTICSVKLLQENEAIHMFLGPLSTVVRFFIFQIRLITCVFLPVSRTYWNAVRRFNPLNGQDLKTSSDFHYTHSHKRHDWPLRHASAPPGVNKIVYLQHPPPGQQNFRPATPHHHKFCSWTEAWNGGKNCFSYFDKMSLNSKGPNRG